jgi:2-keto-3-deoxy-6-phosphogluconate aldolase
MFSMSLCGCNNMKFTKEQLYAKINEVPIMPLFNHSDLALSKAVVKACYDGGIKVFEYTNRGEGAALIFAELVKYIRQSELARFLLPKKPNILSV